MIPTRTAAALALGLLLVPAAVTARDTPTPVATDTARYLVLMQGNRAGTLELWSDGDVAHHRFAFNDRGRGPDLHATVRLGPSGLPARIRVEGVDYLKNAVDERFERTEGTARWESAAETGSARPEGAALYAPVNAPPSFAALAVRSLRALDRSCVPLLPAGELCTSPVDTLMLEGQGERKPVVLHALNGIGFTPQYVWLGTDGRYFATTSGWLAVVPEGWSHVAERLAEAEARARDAWLARIAERVPERPEGPVAITGARLFDSGTGRLRDGTTVVFEGDRITRVGPDGDVPIPTNARQIRAEGRVLLPGLFDMHVHLSPVDGILHLAAGVTSVRDMANDVDELQRMREGFSTGALIGPRVTMAGILDGPGPFAGPTEALVATAEEARQWIRRYADLGYDQIKIYSSIDTALVPALVDAAREHGLRVSGHIPAHMTAEEAVRAGYDEIQHANMLFLNFRSDTLDTRTPVRFSEVGLHGAELDPASDSVQAFFDLLHRRDVVIDPTLAIFENLFTARPGAVSPAFEAVADRLPPQVRRGFLTGGFAGDEERDAYRRAFDRMLDVVVAAYRAGVTVVPGTDALAGFALHRELELYQEAGIDPADVLRIATLTSARVAGRDSALGSIEPGKLADMVLVEGDPTVDVSDVRRPVLVIKDGVLYDPDALYRAVGVAPEGQ